MSQLTTAPATTTLPDVETIAGLIKEVCAIMSRRSPHMLDDASGLDGIPVPHVLFAVQRSFGTQVSPAAIGSDVHTVGELARALAVIVRDDLATRIPEPRPAASRRVLFVGGATAADLERAVAKRGWRAAFLAYGDVANGGMAPRAGELGVVDHVEAIDWAKPFDIVPRIVEMYNSGYIDRVVAIDEFGLLPAVFATTQLGIPASSLRAVHNTRDKYRMRRVLEQAGLAQVRYAVCRDVAEAQAFLERVGGAIILKPATGTGSEGVSRVETADEVAAAFQTAASAAGFTGLLCEEYIEGPEVSLEGYCVDGRFVPVALTDKLTDERFLEIGHQQPTAHPPSVFNECVDIAGRALAALGVEHGVTHTEFRISDRGPVIIETHTRMGGDNIHVLTRLTTGVCLADLMVALGLGETIETRPVPQGRAAAIRFLPGQPGQVKSVTLPVREPEHGIHTFLGPSIGRVCTARSASRDRLAYAIATGATPEIAGQNAETFLSQVRVDFTPQQ